MSQMRQDILTGEWVIYATNRYNKPYEYKKKIQSSEPDLNNKTDFVCSFCPGNEFMTTKAIYQDGEDGNWSIRVFPNMYPALCQNSDEIDVNPLYPTIPGIGIHEVLVDTPNHNEIIHNFEIGHLCDVLKVLKSRLNFMKEKESLKYIQIFKNCGREAGASIRHSHWQILGVPILPLEQSLIFDNTYKYFQKNNRCVFCDIIENELKDRTRLIEENEKFISFVPFAAKNSFEVWITPKAHIASFTDIPDEDMPDLAKILKSRLLGVSKIYPKISYNICFGETPQIDSAKDFFHWYIRIIPRIGNHAGFEFATKTYINPVLPEKAAKIYRNQQK